MMFSIGRCVVMESAANIDGDSGRGTWPNFCTMFEFKAETDNSVKLSLSAKQGCFGVANSPSNLRKHVEVKTE